jgi:ankyrin repeat protein
MRVLLENKAEIEAKDVRGCTALDWAARNGHDAVVRVLMEYKADIEARDGRAKNHV